MEKLNPALIDLFYKEIRKVHDNGELSGLDKAWAYHRLLELIFIELTKAENLAFTTLFARIAYAAHRHRLDKKLTYWVHLFRRKLRSEGHKTEPAELSQLALYILHQLLVNLSGEQVPADFRKYFPAEPPFEYKSVAVKEFRPYVRATAVQDDEENDRMLIHDENNEGATAWLQYNIPDRNEPFNKSIRAIRKVFGFPVTLSLLDVEVAEGDDDLPLYRPRGIVIEPDYLMDVTTVASCFTGYGSEPMIYLLYKFLPSETSKPMMLGNIANFFLDELMNNPEATFKETFPGVFRLNPLVFSLWNNQEVKEVMQKSQGHWSRLKKVISQDFEKEEIEREACFLEPSFYDPVHGLQGRLDVFQKKGSKSVIVELKSGSPFMKNIHQIGASHYVQTLLYDMMVRATFGEKVDPANYILYSKEELKQLRYAPPNKAIQMEALQTRNLLVTFDRMLASLGTEKPMTNLAARITTNHLRLSGFLNANVERFEKAYAGLSDLEKAYFDAFTGMIAREHLLAKTGVQGNENINGLAAIWLDDTREKEDRFELLRALELAENKADQSEPVLVFNKTPHTNPLANFRTGDIALLYPTPEAETDPLNTLSSQVFKVTILEVNNSQVMVRLRYKQFNKRIFEEYARWNLEHDQMDMGFNAMYQGLFRWAESPKEKRSLLLTGRSPGNDNPAPVRLPSDYGTLTGPQRQVLEKMINARDYFLLWGPPGTGKTSQLLRWFVQWIFEHTEENLLLLAYTNRAVDEICEAIESIAKAADNYLRIGSPHSTGSRFVAKLLSEKTAGVASRAALKDILQQHRIVVSTVASLSNKTELLQLKKFSQVVIDEASQILEPQLVGLLPHFEKFILIGDHKQLPAVVVQPPEQTEVLDASLRKIGLTNLRNSLFERLYKRCQEEGWHWAYDRLRQQGRMHVDIMHFPAHQFYEGQLEPLPKGLPGAERQRLPLNFQTPELPQGIPPEVFAKRMVFLDAPVDDSSPSRKTNQFEAETAARLAAHFHHNHPDRSLGIITPYRAQIACILEQFEKHNLPADSITVDTVERYQGGARDVIIISLCTNVASQLESLVSLSDEGVDRKLNVALTRAREQVILLGNKNLLRQNEVYRSLIEWCGRD
ncbi:MAG: DNA helicase [Saprospirales bacterium]|nr:DNA helicase [Saprospirales bacterium]